MLSTEDRAAVLEREVQNYVKRGFRVMSRTDTTAQLVKPKHFSLIIALICFLLAVFPFILYLLIYMASKDETVYISVDDKGKISRK